MVKLAAAVENLLYASDTFRPYDKNLVWDLLARYVEWKAHDLRLSADTHRSHQLARQC